MILLNFLLTPACYINRAMVLISSKGIDKLVKALGDKKVSTSVVERKLYSYDATPIPVKSEVPSAVVFPEGKEDVKRIVEICYEEGIPIFPRGAGSGLTGGAMPTDKGGIVVSFERMNKFRVDKDNATAIVEPGVVTYDFQKYVEKLGLFYPPDPSSYKYSTIGGNVAENAGGPRCVKYGVTREYVLGITAVIKYGEVIRTGNPVIKDVAGYDITKFFVGSEGTLGLITEIILRLIPKPKARRTLLALFDDLSSVGRVVTSLLTSGVFPSALEFMDKDAIKVVNNYKNLGLPDNAEALLLIEVDGNPPSVEEDIKTVCGILEKEGVSYKVAGDEKEEEKLWSARKSLGPALAKIRNGKINEDIVVPRSSLSEAVISFRGLSRKYNLPVVIFGHIGDGNLHVNIMYDKSSKEEEERAERAMEEVFDIALKFGGSITGEHGVGITKMAFLEKQLGKETVNVMKEIKKVFDPLNLFNPGKVFS